MATTTTQEQEEEEEEERPSKRQRQHVESKMTVWRRANESEKTVIAEVGYLVQELLCDGSDGGGQQQQQQQHITGNDDGDDGMLVIPHQKKPILDDAYPSSLLQNMLHPLPETVFLEQFFRKCAVHVPAAMMIPKEGRQDSRYNNNNDNDNNNPDAAAAAAAAAAAKARMQCVQELLCDLDPEQLFRETSSESIFVWLRAPSAATAATDDKDNDKGDSNSNDTQKTLINSIEVQDPDMALALYQAGNATYCRAPEAVEQKLVAALLENTGLGCGQYEGNRGTNGTNGSTGQQAMGRGEVEVFLSAVAGHLTNWHYDFQENFTMQLSGTKRWTMQKGTVQHPVRGCTPHYASPGTVEPQLKAARLADPNFEFGHPETGVNAVGEVESVLLQPGDTFYFPAGMWHKVEVIEPGVSINISLMAANYATVTCQALQHLLLQQDQWREAVVRTPDTGVVDHLKKLLKELPGVIQDFEESGGAEWILPPVLRHGKVTRDPVDDDDRGEEGDDDADGFTEDSDEEQEEDIIDFLKFETPPTGKPLPRILCSFSKNPLASLISEKSITEFYHGSSPAGNNDDEIFVLNINYAGNESHESAVRVRIKEDKGCLKRVINKFNLCENGNRNATPSTLCDGNDMMSAADWKLYECLIHFGYMKLV
jgi:hypothetical protein